MYKGHQGNRLCLSLPEKQGSNRVGKEEGEKNKRKKNREKETGREIRPKGKVSLHNHSVLVWG